MKINKDMLMGALIFVGVFLLTAAAMSRRQWLYLIPDGKMFLSVDNYITNDGTNYHVEVSTNFATDQILKFNLAMSSGVTPAPIGAIGWDYVDDVATLYISTDTDGTGWVKIGAQ